MVREEGGLRFHKSREDFPFSNGRVHAQAVGRDGRYIVAGGQTLSWGTRASLAGTLALEARAELLSISPKGQLLAAGCSLDSGSDPSLKSKVSLQVYSLGERTRRIYERVLVSKVRALTWIDEETLVIGQLVGNVLLLDVPSGRIFVQVGPPSTNEALRPLGGIARFVLGRSSVLAVGRHGLLGWIPGTTALGPKEVLRLVWGQEAEGARIYAALEHEGVLWLFSKEGEALAYSARVADYAVEAGP